MGVRKKSFSDWSMGLPKPINRQHMLLKLPRELMVVRRQPLGRERHRYAMACPDKLGTDLMAVEGANQWTPSRKAGGIP